MKWLRKWPRKYLHSNLFLLFITGTMVGHPRQSPVSTMNHAEIFFVTMVVVADVPDAAVGAVAGVDVDVVAGAGERLLVVSSRPRASPPKCP